MSYIKVKNMKPKLLFKYKSLSNDTTKMNTLDILKNNRLYLPNREKLNDCFEGIHLFALLFQALVPFLLMRMNFL